MIAKVKPVNNPKALINYLFRDKDERMKERSVFIGSQYCSENPNEIKKEWSRYLDNNNRLSKTAMHLIFSLPQDEKLTDDQWRDFVQTIVTDKFGLEDFAWVAVRHKDTDDRHSHLHVAVCRVSPITGKTLSDSKSYYKGMEAAREAEKKYGLQKVHNSWERKQYHFDQRKARLKFKIELAAQKSLGIDDFIIQLAKWNVKVIKSRGIIYVDDKGMHVKGSDRQIGYTLSRLERIFEGNRKQLGLSHERRKLPDYHTNQIPSHDSPDSTSRDDSAITTAMNLIEEIFQPLPQPLMETPNSFSKNRKKKKKKRGWRF